VAKRSNEVQPLPPPTLLISREEAFEKITKRIELGNEIKSHNVTTTAEIKQARSAYYSWNEYNEELLSRMFDNSSIRDGYRKSFGIAHIGEPPLAEQIREFRDDVDYYLRKLESIRDRLEIIELSPKLLLQSARPSQQRTMSKKVFVVHGHDDGMREAVARFIEKLALIPIILSEQPNAGKTIIEKFETSSEDVGYAVVLLSPDDIGYPKDRPEKAQPRARQNVILELGYFVAKLKRSGVCALYKGDVEIPSDYHGVLYLKMDSNWQIVLAKEIKQVIRDIDLNKVFE
jgi:predicted nucleotide-binding protein